MGVPRRPKVSMERGVKRYAPHSSWRYRARFSASLWAAAAPGCVCVCVWVLHCRQLSRAKAWVEVTTQARQHKHGQSPQGTTPKQCIHNCTSDHILDINTKYVRQEQGDQGDTQENPQIHRIADLALHIATIPLNQPSLWSRPGE
jgi:hypothetical protein